MTDDPASPTDPDAPTPAELEDFMNGALPAARRLAVADYLARDAQAGARLLADLHLSESLRAAMPPLDPAPASLTRAAAGLSAAAARRLWLRRLGPVAAAAACFVLGWGAHMLWQDRTQAQQLARLAPLAEAALDARLAADITRSLTLPGQLAPGALADAAAGVGVAMPDLPAGWQVTGVQVVATPSRPALLVEIDTPGLGRITLFSMGQSDLGPDAPPTSFDYRGAAVAVFERHSSAHVLLEADGRPADLSVAAGHLASRVY